MRFAGVAQPVEHRLPKARVASSNLVSRSKKKSKLRIKRSFFVLSQVLPRFSFFKNL